MTTNRATLLLRLSSGITVLVNDLADANYIGLSVSGATIALSADEADHLSEALALAATTQRANDHQT